MGSGRRCLARLLAAWTLMAAGCDGAEAAPSSNGADTGGTTAPSTAGTAAGAGVDRAADAGGAGTMRAPAGSGGSAPDPDPSVTYGELYEGGQFHLGPVDWDETEWHNACAPATKYAPMIRAAEGDLLAGLWNGIPDVASYCDACIAVTTERGKSALLRIVTYGDTSANSIDVSPRAFDLLDSGEFPRAMSFRFAACGDTGPIYYEFQTGSSQWWTSLWVRNARVPLERVEVKSANHSDYVALERGSDGTLTDGAGFGQGLFTLRLHGRDGQEYSDSFEWPAAGIAGQMLEGHGNFTPR